MVELDRILSERSDERILSAVKAVSDQDFTKVVERVLAYLELKVVRSRPKGTFVISDCIHKPDGKRYAVFFSRRDDVISKNDIESLATYMKKAESSDGLVMTTSTIAPDAETPAQKANIGLADGGKVAALFRRFDLDREVVRLADSRRDRPPQVAVPGLDHKLEAAMAEGHQALADKDFMKALDAFDRAILVDDSYDVPWRMKGNTLDEMGYHEQALECYRHALELLPESDETWFSLGNCFFSLSRYNEELMCYDRALLYNPTMQKALVNKGSTLHRLGRYQEALDTYDKILKFNFRLEKVHSNRGATLHKLGRVPEALEAYGRAIELKHDFVEAWTNRGNVQYELGRYEEALEAFTQVTQMRPELPKGWYLKGLAQRKLGKTAQAKASFEQALKLDPDYLEAKRATEDESRKMAERFVEVPRITEDIFASEAARVAANSPEAAAAPLLSEDVVARVHEESVEQLAEEVYGDKAEVLMLLDRLDESSEFLGKSLRLEGESAHLLTAAANVLFRQGKTEVAIKTYEHALSADPTYAPALFNLHTALLAGGEREKAAFVADSLRRWKVAWEAHAVAALDAYRRKEYERALEDIEMSISMEGLAALHNFRGLVKLEAGDLDGAAESFDRSQSMPLDRAEAQNNLGVVLLRKGDHERSGMELDRAIKVQKNYPAVWNNRGCLLYGVERVREAIACFEESLVINPTPVAMTNKGFCQLAIDQLPDAMQTFEQSIKLAETPEAYNNKGIVMKRLGRAPEALVAFNEALRLAPQFKDAGTNLRTPVQEGVRQSPAPVAPKPRPQSPAPQAEVIGAKESTPPLGAVTEESLRGMRKQEIEATCRALGLDDKGTKTELVNRVLRAKERAAKKR
jgi:tetratricopeptide (TPR) repeat protein